MFQNYESLWKAFIRPARQIYSHYDLGPPKLIFKGCSVIRTDIDIKKSNGTLLKCSLFQPSINNHPCSSSSPAESTQYPCVVYCHGNSGCRIDSIAYIEQFASRGIALFSFDFTGSGISDGEYVSLGYHEQNDLVEVINYLRQLPQISEIGIFGRSMGAVTALLYASSDSNLKCLVLDSPFSNLKRLALEIAEQKVPLPQFLLEGILSFISNSIFDRAGFRFDQVDPSKAVSSITIPALFLASNEDKLVKAEHSQTLQQLYKGVSSLKLISGDHNSIRDANVKEFVADYFAEHFQIKYISQRQLQNFTNQSLIRTSKLSTQNKEDIEPSKAELLPTKSINYRNSSSQLLQKRLPCCPSISYQLNNICKQQDNSQISDQVSSSSQTTAATTTNGQLHAISPLSPIENEGLYRIKQLKSQQMIALPSIDNERIKINQQPQITKELRSASENASSSIIPGNNKNIKQSFPLFSNISSINTNKNFSYLRSSNFNMKTEKISEDTPKYLQRNPLSASSLFQKSHLRKLSPKKQRTLKNFLVPSSNNQRNPIVLPKESPTTTDTSAIESERISTIMSINDEFEEFDGRTQQQQGVQQTISQINSIHHQKSYSQLSQGLQKDDNIFNPSEANKNFYNTQPYGEYQKAVSSQQTNKKCNVIIPPSNLSNRNIIPSVFQPSAPLVESSSDNRAYPSIISTTPIPKIYNQSPISKNTTPVNNQLKQDFPDNIQFSYNTQTTHILPSSKNEERNCIYQSNYNRGHIQTEEEQQQQQFITGLLSQDPQGSSRREKRIISLQNFLSGEPTQASNQQFLDQPKHTRQISAVVNSTCQMDSNPQKQQNFNSKVTQSSINVINYSSQTNSNYNNTNNGLIQGQSLSQQKAQSLDLTSMNFYTNISATNRKAPTVTVNLRKEQGNYCQYDTLASTQYFIPKEYQSQDLTMNYYYPQDLNKKHPKDEVSSFSKHEEIYQTQQQQNHFLTPPKSETSRNVLELFPSSKQQIFDPASTSAKTKGLIRIPQQLEKSFSQIPTSASQSIDIQLFSQPSDSRKNDNNSVNQQQENTFSSPSHTLGSGFHNKNIFSLNLNNSITPNQGKIPNQMTTSATPISLNTIKNTIAPELTQQPKQEVFPIKQSIVNLNQGYQQQHQQQQQQQLQDNNYISQFQNTNQQSLWQNNQPLMFQTKTAIFKETKQSINLTSSRAQGLPTHRPSQSMQLTGGKHF